MKCPDCGFECLPGDVECLACGVDIVLAAENKEKERVRAIEARERKEKYDIELKKELGLIPDDDEPVVKEPVQGKTLQDVFKKKPACPKCGADRHAESVECIRCGLIFEKYKYGVKQGSQNGSGNGSQANVAPVPVWTERDDDRTDEIDIARLDQLLTEEAVTSDDDLDQPLEMESASGRQETYQPEKPAVTDLMSDNPGMANGSGLMSQAVETSVQEKDKLNVRKDGQPRYKIRNPQIPESTWTIYKRKLNNRSHSLISALNSGWNAFETWSGGKKKAVRNTGIVICVVLLVASSPFLYSLITEIRNDYRIKAEAERQKQVQLDFMSHRDAISKRIKEMVDQRMVDKAEKEMALYNIPALKNELVPLENYIDEYRIMESVKNLPESQFEKQYEAYSRLSDIDPQNGLYAERKEIFRQKYADSEYMKALSYYNSGKKDPAMLDKSIKTVKKSVSLYPGSAKYQSLKQQLMKERLLFYDGNDKIAMAARDDGMGRNLYSDQRKISVWIVNKSQETVFINVQYFTMLGKNGLSYTYNDMGNRLSGKIEPGEQTWGELYFRTGTSPARLTFNHLVCGKIYRDFP